MVDRINTSILPDTNIIANKLNYDEDYAILQQGSVKLMRKKFERLEHPNAPRDENGEIIDHEKIEKEKRKDFVTVGSIGMIINIILFIVFSIIVIDYVKSSK